MRTQIKITHTENMFGHTYVCDVPGQPDSHTILENHDQAWHHNQKRVTKPYYWFRAPKIRWAELETTLKNLCDLTGTCELKVWHSDQGLDASLKMKDDADAASWAWSHTEMWAKWSQAEEQAWRAAQKPRKLKVRKDGSVRVKVTVSELSDV